MVPPPVVGPKGPQCRMSNLICQNVPCSYIFLQFSCRLKIIVCHMTNLKKGSRHVGNISFLIKIKDCVTLSN